MNNTQRKANLGTSACRQLVLRTPEQVTLLNFTADGPYEALLAAFRGMGLWALRLSFTTENAGEVDKVLADWVRGGTFEPGSYTRGLYQRGVE